MTRPLVDRAPRVRCYVCGSDRLFSLCHHCQWPMCEEHSPPAFRQAGALVRTPVGRDDEARPASKEFAGLGLDGLREAVYHCRTHEHMVRGFPTRWVAAGAAVAALGLILLFVAPTAGLPLLLIGVGGSGLPLAIHRWRSAAAIRPPLPLVPQVNTVDLVERLTGSVRLENDDYASEVESVGGEVTVVVSANDGHDRLRRYRDKFRLPEFEPVEFAGGYLMLEGEVGLAFQAGQSSILAGGVGISLGAESAADHELFPDDPDLPQRESTLVIDYQVEQERTPGEIPLWIVPSLLPGSDRRTLEIDLHWNTLGDEERELTLASFDLIELAVPVSWGSVESFAPDRVEVARIGGRRVIRWKQHKPPRSGTGSITLKLRFERPVTEVPATLGAAAGDPGRPPDAFADRLTLAGTIEATFEGLLSGVTGVGVYLPGGGKGQGPEVKTQTQVAVSFDVSLRSIRYQKDRVVPDPSHADDVASFRTRAVEVPGVVPDYRTVAALTDAISADNFYVKSVVEHVPYRDDGRPGVLNRVWDIAGRRYAGIFPIDFDVNLRGEEMTSVHGSTGKTVAQVTVKGAYVIGTLVDAPAPLDPTAVAESAWVEADEQGDELLRWIEETWTGLDGWVRQVLGGIADRARRNGAAIEAAERVVEGEPVGPHEPGPRRQTIVVPPAETPAPARTSPGSAGEDLTRRADLHRQRRSLDDALIAGRMSEQTYHGIVARIEAELGELGETP